MIHYTRVQTFRDLESIKSLQEKNLKQNLLPEEKLDQGFLTAEYSLSFLEKMNRACPSFLAKHGEDLVGYALVADPLIREDHDLLKDLFERIDETQYLGTFLRDSRYIVVGQLCVDKSYSGQGIAQNLYKEFKKALHKEYEYCVTDIAEENHRSLKTHLTAGFKIIGNLSFSGNAFKMVLWDWNQSH